MATVRAYGGRKVEQGAIPGARLTVERNPNQYGAGLGAVASKLASNELEAVAERNRAQREAELKRMNEIAVIAASNQLDAFENDLMYGDSGLMRRKGSDSFGAYDNFEKVFQAKGDDLENGLANEEQKLMFLRKRSSKFDSASGRLRQHIAAETEKFDTQESQKQLENITSDAIRSYGSPREIALKLGEAEQTVLAYADRNGLGKNQTEAMMQDITSKIHEGVIDNLLADDEKSAGAETYFQALKAQIDPKRWDEIQKSIETGSVRRKSQQEADKIVAESKTQTEALAKVKLIEDPKLRDETEDRVVREFQRQKAATQLDEEESMIEAGNILDRTNGNVQKIPARMWERFSPSQKASLKSYSKRDAAGGEGGGGGLGQWMKLMEESVADPAKFKARDLTRFMGAIGKTELKDLQRRQNDLREGKASKEIDDFRTENQVIEGAMDGIIDGKKDPAAKAKVVRAVAEKQQDFIKRTGKQATHADLEKMTDEALSEQVKIKGSQVWDFNPFNNSDETKPVLNLKISDIPTAERRRIEAKLRSIQRPVNDREVMRFFVDENKVR